MKLSTIIRAIVRPYVEVHSHDDALTVWLLGSHGPGVALRSQWIKYGVPERATVANVGGLTVAWWGRDTMVHTAPEAT